jgi:hypothetical protein
MLDVAPRPLRREAASPWSARFYASCLGLLDGDGTTYYPNVRSSAFPTMRRSRSIASLLASCQLHGIEPWGYLRDVFC